MNLFDLKNIDQNKEVVDILCQSDDIRIEKIISTGQTSNDWYDQDENEWVSVLKGNAKLKFLDKEVTLNEGDSILIKNHQKHKVIYTSDPCVWLCVFFKAQ